MATAVIYSKEEIPDIFIDIKPPEYQYFKIDLIQVDSVTKEKKSGKEVKRTHDYKLNIDASKINNDHIPELSAVLKDLFHLAWAPYTFTTKTYKYFTTRQQEQSVKHSQLTQIFEYLQEFELEYNKKIANSIELFHKDSVSKQSYSDAEVVVKFDEEKQAFVILALSYLGAEKYGQLSKASFEKGTLEDQYPDSFFEGLVEEKRIQNKKKKIFYFLVEPQSYLSVKNLIEKQTKENIEFYEAQTNLVKTLTVEDLPLYNKPNIFDFKIEFNDSLKCFIFYSKSFNKSMYEGNQTPRSLIGKIAVNYIYSEEIIDEEIFSLYPNNHNDDEIDFPNHKKIILDFKPGSSVKDKKFIVAATDIAKMQKLKDNFLKCEELFSRPQTVIKIVENDIINGSYKKHPAMYLDEKGNIFLILSYRNIAGNTNTTQNYLDNYYPIIKDSNPTEEDFSQILDDLSKLPKKLPKMKKERLSSVNMTGIPITYPEFMHFITEHPWAKNIKDNSFSLNTDIWLKGENPNLGTTEEEREKMFANLIFRAKLNHESEKKPTTYVKKKKI